MSKFYLDTEFIFFIKDKCNFVQVSVLNPYDDVILDYHLKPGLYKFEKSRIQKALSGAYGESSQKAIQSVMDIYNGKYNIDMSSLFNGEYKKINIKMNDLKNELNQDTYYVWDKSSDKYLFANTHVEVIDIQKRWEEKFGIKSMSLSNAYLTTLYNMGLKDVDNLHDNAHFACVDVLMLKYVDEFIETFEGDLKLAPISIQEYDNKLLKLNDDLNFVLNKIDELKNTKDQIDEIEYTKLSDKFNNRLYAINKKHKQLTKLETYKAKWW